MLRLVCLLLVALAGLGAAEPKPLLHPLFSDQAVLQRGKPVALWGWAAPGAEVTVTLAGEGLANASATVTAAANGRWQAALGPFAAGGPYVLGARSGTASVEAKDVLVGDVWLCSGQSNMEMQVATSDNAAEEKKNANWPQIRHIRVERTNVATPQELIRGQWKAATPDNVLGFTAAGYFMARKLHQDLQVPIGLVHSSWGGTRAESWTSAEALATLPDQAKALADFQALSKRLDLQKTSTGKDFAELITEWYAVNDPGTGATEPWSTAQLDASTWTAAALPAQLEDAGAIPAAWDGTVWLRRTVELPAADAGRPAMLFLGRIEDAATVWVNGQQVGDSDQPGDRRHPVPAKMLTAGTNSIAVRLTDVAGKCGIIGKPEAMSLIPQGGTAVPLAGEWRVRTGVELNKAPALPLRLAARPDVTTLYNGMIAPLVPMSLTGAIWYQGESNAGNAAGYRALLPVMIADWRARFGQGDFPFLIVSLASFMKREPQPMEQRWAELREAQAMVAKSVPACGLAIAIDIGDERNIHPTNKQEVGRRLALAAEAIAYQQPVVWSGPWYAGMAVEDGRIRLRFDHLGGGLASSDDKPLVGFAIAGEDRVWVWADAVIDGDTVVVSSPTVAKPVAVRYAWANNPACNLMNKAGLPAVPFRTDNWPRAEAKPAK